MKKRSLVQILSYIQHITPVGYMCCINLHKLKQHLPTPYSTSSEHVLQNFTVVRETAYDTMYDDKGQSKKIRFHA